MAKFEITNPEALKFLNDFKSGALFLPVKIWIIKYKWFLVGGGILLTLILFLAIGKAISGRNQAPVFTPPDLALPSISVAPEEKSEFEFIRQNIIDFSSDLPDPVLPPLDNAINLESDNI